MHETNKPIIAGILNIISGALSIITGIGSFIGFYVVSGAWGIPGMETIPAFVPGIVLGTATFYIIFGVIALIGGLFSVQRKQWGWTIAGSIAAILVVLPLGIASTILAALSKIEFE